MKIDEGVNGKIHGKVEQLWNFKALETENIMANESLKPNHK